MRPSQARISERIRNQMIEKHQRADQEDHLSPREKPVELPTREHVTKQYAATKAAGWADPERPPEELGNRLTYLECTHDTVHQTSAGKSLSQTGLMGRDGKPKQEHKHSALAPVAFSSFF